MWWCCSCCEASWGTGDTVLVLYPLQCPPRLVHQSVPWKQPTFYRKFLQNTLVHLTESVQRSGGVVCGVSDGLWPLGSARRDYLTGDEVLAHRQSHLDGVGLVRYGDGGQLEFVPAVHLVGLGHRIFEDLLVPLLAEDRPDVHDLRLAAGPRAGAREEHRQQEQTHRVDHQTAQRGPVAFLPGGGSARPASGRRHGSSQWRARLQTRSRWAARERERERD